MKDALQLTDVEISLSGKRLIELTETIRAGEVVTVMGPSGSGKSTLLAYIGGFLDPAFIGKGTVCLDDTVLNTLSAEKRRVGILFQDALLFPHLSVGENLLFAVPQTVRQKSERRERAEAALAAGELSGFFDRDPATLSGGQKARVALMRVLLAEPKALLLDEPFSKLDTELRGSIRSFVLEEAKRRRLPVLLVTHDESDAKAAGGTVINLSNKSDEKT